MSGKTNLAVKNSKPSKKKLVIISSIVIALLVCLAGIAYYFYAASHTSSDDAFIECHAIAVSPKVSGHVLKVYIDDNQLVKAGELLAEIDPRDYMTRCDMAQANLESAQTKAAQAGEDAVRYKKLTLSDEISKQDMERVIVKAHVANAEALVAKAALSQAKLDLSYTKIYAPAKGRVTQKALEEGAFVQIGQTILTVVTPERWVIANLKETDLKNIVPGQEVIITVDAYPGKEFKGHVDSVQRGTGSRFSLLPAENATGNYIKIVQRIPVKIVFDDEPDAGHPLALGMSVIPVIKTKCTPLTIFRLRKNGWLRSP